MAKKKHQNVDPEVLAAFQQMAGAVAGVVIKGDTSPYVSINGNMYGSISKAGVIGMRLPKAAREAFMETHGSGLHEPFPGFHQKEYVAVPAELHRDTVAMRALFAESHAYAAGLKPKATTRKKPPR